MFFRNKALPITETDREWVDSAIDWMLQSFGEKHFYAIKTVTPTTAYYPKKDSDSYKYAENVLGITMSLMAINENTKVYLEFFSQEFFEDNNSTQLDKGDNLNGYWAEASGTYQRRDEKVVIRINENLLDDPISLISTMAHELAHEILLGENRINENDEYLTDLLAIFYGFGIFLGNSKFNYNTASDGFTSSWSMSSKGYLPEQIIAYATAKLSILRKEDISYQKFMTSSFAKCFNKTLKHLREEEKKRNSL